MFTSTKTLCISRQLLVTHTSMQPRQSADAYSKIIHPPISQVNCVGLQRHLCSSKINQQICELAKASGAVFTTLRFLRNNKPERLSFVDF